MYPAIYRLPGVNTDTVVPGRRSTLNGRGWRATISPYPSEFAGAKSGGVGFITHDRARTRIASFLTCASRLGDAHSKTKTKEDGAVWSWVGWRRPAYQDRFECVLVVERLYRGLQIPGGRFDSCPALKLNMRL